MPLALPLPVSAPLIGGRYGPHLRGGYLAIPGQVQRRENRHPTRPYSLYLGIGAGRDFSAVAEYGRSMAAGRARAADPTARQAAGQGAGTGSSSGFTSFLAKQTETSVLQRAQRWTASHSAFAMTGHLFCALSRRSLRATAPTLPTGKVNFIWGIATATNAVAHKRGRTPKG